MHRVGTMALPGRTITGSKADLTLADSKRKWTAFIYTREMVIRELISPGQHRVRCTHCTTCWDAPSSNTDTKKYVAHFTSPQRKGSHKGLPINEDMESDLIQSLMGAQPSAPKRLDTRDNPFARTAGSAAINEELYTEVLLEFLIDTNSSLSIVDRPSFHKFVKLLNRYVFNSLVFLTTKNSVF